MTGSLRRRGSLSLMSVVDKSYHRYQTVMVWSGGRVATRKPGLDLRPGPPPAGLSTSMGWLGRRWRPVNSDPIQCPCCIKGV